MFGRPKSAPAEADSGGLQVRVSQLAPCQHKLHILVDVEGVQPVREQVVQEFQKEAAIAGFRKGKAPRNLVETKFPSEIREETIRRLTQHTFERVQHEKKLKPVGPFEITNLKFDDATGLELEAHVEVEPEFALGHYRGLRVTRPAVAVTPEDIERALARIQESMAELAPGEAGQPKERRVPPIDDELAKDVGFEALDQLKSHVTEKVREQKQAEQARAVEEAVCDALLAQHRFEVPPRLVEHQAERLRRDFHVRLLLTGLTEEQVKEQLGQYTEQLKTNAARHVALGFILERIAQKEELSVTQDEIVDRLWKLASRWRKDPNEVRRLLDEKGLWPSVLSSIRQEKTVQFLLRVAQIEEEQKTEGAISTKP